MVTERELVLRLALITGHNKDIVGDVLRAMNEFVMDELADGIPVRLGKLGEFSTYTSECNGGYDFKMKKLRPRITVTKVKFRCSNTLRRAVHASEG